MTLAQDVLFAIEANKVKQVLLALRDFDRIGLEYISQKISDWMNSIGPMCYRLSGKTTLAEIEGILVRLDINYDVYLQKYGSFSNI